jgi:calcium permeable stress-gated cation channel
VRGDAQNNSLEKRFGHPALHAELFTPMLHKNMMPLLSEVYHGKINSDLAKLDEYGGQKMEAQVVPGGLKIAAIDQVCSRVFDTTLALMSFLSSSTERSYV